MQLGGIRAGAADQDSGPHTLPSTGYIGFAAGLGGMAIICAASSTVLRSRADVARPMPDDAPDAESSCRLGSGQSNEF